MSKFIAVPDKGTIYIRAQRNENWKTKLTPKSSYHDSTWTQNMGIVIIPQKKAIPTFWGLPATCYGMVR